MIYLGRMKPACPPRLLAVFFIVLLALSFLIGTTLAFKTVQAAALLTPTGTPAAGTATPPLTPTTLTQTPAMPPGSANLTGILVLGILLVAIIVIGLLWGGRVTRR